jgi:hypothetical protein
MACGGAARLCLQHSLGGSRAPAELAHGLSVLLSCSTLLLPVGWHLWWGRLLGCCCGDVTGITPLCGCQQSLSRSGARRGSVCLIAQLQHGLLQLQLHITQPACIGDACKPGLQVGMQHERLRLSLRFNAAVHQLLGITPAHHPCKAGRTWRCALHVHAPTPVHAALPRLLGQPHAQLPQHAVRRLRHASVHCQRQLVLQPLLALQRQGPPANNAGAAHGALPFSAKITRYIATAVCTCLELLQLSHSCLEPLELGVQCCIFSACSKKGIRNLHQGRGLLHEFYTSAEKWG